MVLKNENKSEQIPFEMGFVIERIHNDKALGFLTSKYPYINIKITLIDEEKSDFHLSVLRLDFDARSNSIAYDFFNVGYFLGLLRSGK